MSNENRRNALWVTMVQAGLLGVVAGCAATCCSPRFFRRPVRAEAQGPPPARASHRCRADSRGPPPFGPGGFGGERPLVAKFDKDGDKRLDTAERKAAREWLAAEPARGGSAAAAAALAGSGAAAWPRAPARTSR